MAKPVLLVTRRLPPAVEARAAAEFGTRLTKSEMPIPDVLARAAGADAILTCPGDNFDADADRCAAGEREGDRDIQRRATITSTSLRLRHAASRCATRPTC